jgi:hypothetical protein
MAVVRDETMLPLHSFMIVSNADIGFGSEGLFRLAFACSSSSVNAASWPVRSPGFARPHEGVGVRTIVTSAGAVIVGRI